MRIALVIFCVLFLNSCLDYQGKDTSLTLKEYRKSGMPDPDRVWLSNDFALAYAVLEDIKAKRPSCLPIKDSNKSGMVFERMTSKENLPFLHDAALPDELKLRMTKSFIQICDNWIKIYNFDESKEQYYHRELTEIYLFVLEISEIMLGIYDQIQASFELGNQENIIDENPVQPIYLSVLFNILRFEDKTEGYSIDDHMLMAKTLRASLQKNKVWMEESIKNDLKQALNKLKDQQTHKELENHYLELIESL